MTRIQRETELRRLLLDHRATLELDVQSRVRASRDGHPPEGRDDMEQSDDNIRGDLTFALLQMKCEALAGIEAALDRLDTNCYGVCVSCDRPIPTRRLRALPFAIRCQPCAEAREREQTTVAAPSRWGPVTDIAPR